jgi:hypothetical protein
MAKPRELNRHIDGIAADKRLAYRRLKPINAIVADSRKAEMRHSILDLLFAQGKAANASASRLHHRF